MITRPGKYRTTLTSSFGCSVIDSFEVLSSTYNSIAEALTVQHTCPGIDNGSIRAFFNGNGTALNQLWSTGDVLIGDFSGNAKLENLAPGNYWVEPIDTSGCVRRFHYEVEDNTAFTATPNFHYATCGGLDGKIWIDANPPGNYTYQWEGSTEQSNTLSNLASGIYRVTVTDSMGCERHKEIDLGFNNELKIDIDSTGSCVGNGEWTLKATIPAGNLNDITFEWSTGQTDFGTESTITSIAPGSYWLIASNSLCQSDTTHLTLSNNVVAQPLTIDQNLITPPSCIGGNDGAIQLEAIGGSGGPYSYVWEDGTDTTLYNNLSEGTYHVTITDVGGCMVIDSFTLQSTVPFQAWIDTSNTDLKICAGNLASVTVLTNSTAPVFYHDKNGINLGQNILLPQGLHRISVFTDGGCVDYVDVYIEEEGFQPEFETLPPSELCPGMMYTLTVNALAVSSITNATINNQVWDFSNSTDLSTGTYDLYIEETDGCTWDTTFIIQESRIDISLQDTIEVMDEEVTIEALIQSTSSAYLDWSAVEDINCTDTSSCSLIRYTPKEDEQLQVVATNQEGCIASDSIFIKVVSEVSDTFMTVSREALFYIPNIVNLESQIRNNICVELTDVVVSVDNFTLYNRWGNIVAGPLNNIQESPTCLLDNNLITTISTGVYIFVIEVSLIDGRVVKQAGDVTVVR